MCEALALFSLLENCSLQDFVGSVNCQRRYASTALYPHISCKMLANNFSVAQASYNDFIRWSFIRVFISVARAVITFATVLLLYEAIKLTPPSPAVLCGENSRTHCTHHMFVCLECNLQWRKGWPDGECRNKLQSFYRAPTNNLLRPSVGGAAKSIIFISHARPPNHLPSRPAPSRDKTNNGKRKEISRSAHSRSLNCISSSKGMINYARLTPSSLKCS
jgi:hypothetical protein